MRAYLSCNYHLSEQIWNFHKMDINTAISPDEWSNFELEYLAEEDSYEDAVFRRWKLNLRYTITIFDLFLRSGLYLVHKMLSKIFSVKIFSERP